MNSAQRRKQERKFRYQIPLTTRFDTNYEWEEGTQAADDWCKDKFGRESWVREGWAAPVYRFKKAKHATLFGLMWG